MSFENFDLFTGEYRDKSLGKVAVPTEQDVLSEVARGLMGSSWRRGGLRWVDKVTPRGRHLLHLYTGPSDGMWATPMAQEPGNKVDTYDVGNARRGDSSSNFGMCLSQQVRVWPTPGKVDYKPGRKPESWQKAADKHAEKGVNKQMMLRDAVMWPTPRAGKTTNEDEESWRARQAKGDVSTPPLSLAVKMWPTPTFGDGKSSGSRNTDKSNAHPGVSLTDAVRGDGGRGRKQMSSGSGGQLNPTWVAWLMGFPLRWLKKEGEEWFR